MLLSTCFSSLALSIQPVCKMDQHKKLIEKFLKQLASSRTSPILSEDTYVKSPKMIKTLDIEEVSNNGFDRT